MCAGDLDDFGETATAGFGESLSGPDSRWPGHIAADWLSAGGIVYLIEGVAGAGIAHLIQPLPMASLGRGLASVGA